MHVKLPYAISRHVKLPLMLHQRYIYNFRTHIERIPGLAFHVRDLVDDGRQRERYGAFIMINVTNTTTTTTTSTTTTTTTNTMIIHIITIMFSITRLV